MKVTTDFEYDGKTGQLYKIWIVNVLLSIITLGIYRFWAKTRVRKYTTSSFSLHGDRFEYTGSGKELFLGFLKALIFLLIISIPFFWSVMKMQEMEADLLEKAQQMEQQVESDNQIPTLKKPGDNSMGHSIGANPETETPEPRAPEFQLSDTPEEYYIPVLVYVIYLIFFLGFIPFVAKYQALRYRSARLQWRGVRAHLRGSAIWYGILGFINVIVMIVTAFLWKPFGDMLLLRYKMRRLQYGELNGNLDNVNYLKVFLMFLGVGVMTILTLILGFVLMAAIMGIMVGGTSPEQFDAQMQQNPLMIFVTMLFALVIYLPPIYFYMVYKAAVNRELYNNLKFGSVGFTTEMTGMNLFGYHFVNFLIIVFTLGLGYPIVIQRKQKFLKKHVKVTGDIDSLSTSQPTGKKYKTGEGLFAFFDLKINIF